MAIENFIDFATDRIRPDVFNEYKNSAAYVEGDFEGGDQSTGDYTKLAWVMSVRKNMQNAGLVTAEIDQLVNELFISPMTINGEIVPNYRTLSLSGYNLAQILMFDYKLEDNFDLNYIINIETKLGEILNKSQSNSILTASEMAVEFSMHHAIPLIATSVVTDPISGDEKSPFYAMSTENTASSRFSIYLNAIIKVATKPDTGDAVGTTNEEMTLAAIDSALDSVNFIEHYNEIFFRNSLSQAECAQPKNEIARMLTYLRGAPLLTACEIIIPKITPLAGESDERATIMGSLYAAATNATGLSVSRALFDKDIYLNLTAEIITNKGYSPLFFYVARARASAEVTVLTELKKVFSFFSVALSDGLNDGFTPMSILTYALTIDSGSWVQTDLVAFIKIEIVALHGSMISSGATNNYVTTTALGSVRDLTSGASQNLFGTYNIIMLRINESHKAWWAENQSVQDTTVSDYNPTIDTLLSNIMGSDFTSTDYNIWTAEYQKEVE